MRRDSPYFSVHSHTSYSVLDGMTTPADIVEQAAWYRMPAMAEEWRVVFGYPKYQVSNLGCVIGANGRVLRQWKQKRGGYPAVKLSLGANTRRTVCVHTLVLEAFVSPRPVGTEACHRDGNPENNTVGNLYWGTRKENVGDMYKHGTWSKSRPTTYGQLHHMAKITDEEAEEIRRMFIPGTNQWNPGNGKQLAEEYGISHSHVLRIAKGKVRKNA